MSDPTFSDLAEIHLTLNEMEMDGQIKTLRDSSGLRIFIIALPDQFDAAVEKMAERIQAEHGVSLGEWIEGRR